MSDCTDLPARLRDLAQAILGPSEVFLAYAHGSRIHGRATSRSDLDIGYYAGGYPGATSLPLEEELRIEDRFAQSLGIETDFRGLARAPLEVRGRVLEQGVRIYCADDVARVNLERDLLSRWHDWKPSCLKLHEQRLGQLARLRHHG